jgi:hypothetical protein
VDLAASDGKDYYRLEAAMTGMLWIVIPLIVTLAICRAAGKADERLGLK